MGRAHPTARATLAALGLLVAACSNAPSPAPAALTPDEQKDPASCKTCHASHYGEWAGSVHAGASDDPLFRAMNARAQRETGGAIGNLCVRCHAPAAVATGATTNGLNLAALPAAMHGVTCYFCHSVDAVNGSSDNPLHLAAGGPFRAGIANPVTTPAHDSAYSALHDRDVASSASLCGACHDVTLSNGLAIEQTFAEWQSSIYAQAGTLVTCGKCHMAGTQGLAANVAGALPTRTVHDHSVPGVDLPFETIASTDGGADAAAIHALIDPALSAKLCVQQSDAGPGATIALTLGTAVVGHAFPSGAVHDRRAWVEVVASANGDTVFTSGVVPNDQTSVESLGDPNLWLFKEALFDVSQNPVLFMWEAASAETVSLPPAVTGDPTDPRYDHAVTKTYAVPASALPAGTSLDQVTVRVRIAPVALEVIAALVASGDLDPSYQANLPVYTLAGTALAWTAANGGACVP